MEKNKAPEFLAMTKGFDTIDVYYPLFLHLASTYDLVLTEEELNEIIKLAREIK